MTKPSPLALDIVSDTICPWCYVGKRHLEAALPVLAAEGLHFNLTWRPFQLNPDMPAGGVERRVYRTAKFGSWERSQSLDAQIAEAGKQAGLLFRHDLMQRTPNSVASHVLVAHAFEAGGAVLQDRVVEALFAAYFTRGADVGDHTVLAGIAADCGLDPGRVSAALVEPARIDAIVREDRRLRGQGFGGVPSFVLGGYFLFSGAQPAGVMVASLRDAAAQIRAIQLQAEPTGA
jgi:predicted DsbA family dithiol-disulfide isomerase